MSAGTSHIAIVGGGLCGLALAAALTHRSIPYRIYESRSSFTELGAGINLGTNAIRAFDCIDPALGHAIRSMCTRNPPPKQDVWMQFRYGAPTTTHKDYELITELMAPPIGNMTAHRNELLQMLADRCPRENVFFNKKLTHLEQSDTSVILEFADGTAAEASIVVACDGIHSSVRRSLLADDRTALPQFTGVGAYRALISLEQAEAVFGKADAPLGQLLVGPGGYMVRYAVAGGKHVAIGFWTYHKDDWTHAEWVLPHRRTEMLKTFGSWGDTIRNLVNIVPDPSFWAAYCHTEQPLKFHKGRVCLIGDAAHSMPPHHGAGAGQAMEDAYVMAEVLSSTDFETGSIKAVNAAFEAFDSVRRPHAQQVLDSSIEAMSFLADFYKPDLSTGEIEEFKLEAYDRWHFIWDYDILGAAKRACEGLRLDPA